VGFEFSKKPGPKGPGFGPPPRGLNGLSSLAAVYWIEINSKSQISNNKQITMTKIQNSKPVLVI
jgi:hypothetical protein